eukprot:sb/3470834/
MFYLLLCFLSISLADQDWIAVKTDSTIPCDLENTPLEIKTKSALGGEDQIWIKFVQGEGSQGSIEITFSSPMKYRIGGCMSTDGDQEFPTIPTEEKKKMATEEENSEERSSAEENIKETKSYGTTETPEPPEPEEWVVSKTLTSLTIARNGVEVLNYIFANAENENCRFIFEGDSVEGIIFSQLSFSLFRKREKES